jgi:hypothetical protein
MPDLRLTELVQRVDQDKLVIPEFQRGFKWQTPDIRKLLESLLLDFPIGAALLWRTQSSTLEFRRIEDVQFSDGDGEDDASPDPQDELKVEEIDFILDGQQRITSIYKLFPVTLAPTGHELESRFKGLRFFLDLDKLGLPRELSDLHKKDFSSYKDPDIVASAIVEKRHSDLRKEYRTVSGDKAPQRLSDENILLICQRKRWLPLTRAFLENKQTHFSRLRRGIEADLKGKVDSYPTSEPRSTLLSLVDDGLDRWADWFTSGFQATLNAKSLTCLIYGNDQSEGLARIFETINSTGLSLSVFDLLVARLGTWKTAQNETSNLRKLVLASVEKGVLQKFDDDRSLGGTASQQLPRLMALRAGIELKKGEILKAKKTAFLNVVGSAGPGLNCALSTLTIHMGVIDDSYLPFKDLIALIGATYSGHWNETKDRVIAFLWTICLVEDWDSSTNDKTRAAFRQLADLLNGNQASDVIVKRLEKDFPDFDQVRDATSKASLIFRTFMAFNLARGGIDWAGSARSTAQTQEDHHIFPREWLLSNREQSEDKQTWASLRDSVLNRIFVSRQANLDARAQTPPNYLGGLTAAERRQLQIPESFLGPLATPITAEAFSAFLKDRYELIRQDFIDYVRQGLASPTANLPEPSLSDLSAGQEIDNGS